MHDEGRKDQCVSLAESDPVAGPLAIKDLDPATVISAVGQLDDHRYLAQAHLTAAEVHVPVVLLARHIARQLQLTHFVGKSKPVPRVIECGDIAKALEDPPGFRRARNPEQVAVPDQTIAAARYSALHNARPLMQRNDALALLRSEPAGKDLAVIKCVPHVDCPKGAAAVPARDPIVAKSNGLARDCQ